jgi:ABC-type uncharacterized transport system substrate-binding protein
MSKDGTIRYERRSTAGRAESMPQLVTELVQARVDVSFTARPLPVRAVMQATSTIPIVFRALGGAIAAGAVGSLAHPDRNATGLSFLNFRDRRQVLPTAARGASRGAPHRHSLRSQ